VARTEEFNKLLSGAQRDGADEYSLIKDKNTEEVLKEIFVSSEFTGLQDGYRISRTMANVSTLLFKLSTQAENQTKKIINLTKWLVFLTAVVSVFTIFLIIQGFKVL
jgi:hypothetical protein